MFHYKNLDQVLLQKIKILKHSNKLRFNEIQIWVDGSNIAHDYVNSYIGNYETYPNEALPSTNAFNNNIDVSNITSSFEHSNSNYPNIFYIELTRSYKITEIQSIILYNYRGGETLEEIKNEGLYNSYFELIDTSDIMFTRFQLTDNSNAYKIKGLAREYSLSNTESSTNALSDTAIVSGSLSNTVISVHNIEENTTFDTSSVNLPLQNYTKPNYSNSFSNFIPKYSNIIHHLDFINYGPSSALYLKDLGNQLDRLDGTSNGTINTTVNGINFLDGSENYIDLSNVIIGNDFTLSIWFNIYDISNTNQSLINFSQNYITDSSRQKIEIKNAGNQNNNYSLNINISDNDYNNTTWSTGNLFTRSTNHNLTISFGTSNSLIYVDGNLISTNSTPTILNTPILRGTHYLGKEDNPSSYKDFSISKFSIWNTILTTSEVLELYNKTFNFKFEVDVSESKLFVMNPCTLTFNNGSANKRLSNYNVPQETNFNNHFDFYNVSDKISTYGNDLGLSTNKRNATIYSPYYDKSIDNSGISTENLVNNGNFQSWNVSPPLPTNSFILNGNSRSLTDIYSSSVLTLNGSPTFDTNGVTLDGSSQYITIPQSIGSFGTDDFTISLWIQATNTLTNRHQHILSLAYNTTGWILVDVAPTSNLVRTVHGSNNNQSNFAYPVDSTDHNYILTRKSNILKLFIDGVSKTTSTSNENIPSADYHIGHSIPRNGGHYLYGIVKRVDIWKGTGF